MGRQRLRWSMVRKWKVLAPYWYFLPLFAVISMLMIYPLIDGLYLSFWHKDLLRPNKDKFVGFENYRRLLFEDELFWPALRNSVIFTLASVFFEYLMGLGSGAAT